MIYVVLKLEFSGKWGIIKDKKRGIQELLSFKRETFTLSEPICNHILFVNIKKNKTKETC